MKSKMPTIFVAFNLMFVMSLTTCQTTRNEVVKQNKAIVLADQSYPKIDDVKIYPPIMVRLADKPYPVVVDYNSSSVEMIANGKYDIVDKSITTNSFYVAGKGQVASTLYLIHFNCLVTNKEVENHLKSLDLKSAKIEHLLAFGVKYPEKQRKFTIIALGSSLSETQGRVSVPCLSSIASLRMFCLASSDEPDRSEWPEDFRFLAVKQ